MITVGSEAYILKTHNVSSTAKTGDELLKLVDKDIEYAEKILKVIVIGWCCDDGGDGRKMRRLLLSIKPWLLIFPCWAHQLNLVVGDLFKADDAILLHVNEAIELVKWFNSHSRGLGLLNVEQASLAGGKVLALILPVISRWTAHFCSLSRLLNVKGPVQAAWAKYEDKLLACAGPKLPAKIKAREVQQTATSRTFWESISTVCEILEPLAVAANILQAPNTRLCDVLLTLGNLFLLFSDKDRYNPTITEAIIKSLEKRWAAADQPILILSLVLNPYIRGRCFNTSGHITLTRMGFFNLAKQAYTRIFRSDPGSGFLDLVTDYLDGFEAIARDEGTTVDVVRVWENINQGTNTGRNRLTCLAIVILSVVPNSAGCERLFSEFGTIHTKKRCRLKIEKVHKMSLVRMDLRRQHIAEGIAPKSRKRKFGTEKAPEETSMPSEEATEPCEEDETRGLLVDEASDFGAVVTRLINDAEEVEVEEGHSSSSPLDGRQQAIGRSVPLPQAANQSSGEASSSRRPSAEAKIPLSSLFLYPSRENPVPWAGFDKFWAAGKRYLVDEIEVHEEVSSGLLDGQLENTVEDF
ncbi:ribonuclease H-like domain-containing protein [Coprinopsis sp. MPI-PUGE-AT-0042]|nr:ribonuclease H-like domain-containing protein [Coprinopsis sp. MPI-PUGE-AT-0042]